jgi:predicted nuclease of predicted toxin-antitoxin system
MSAASDGEILEHALQSGRVVCTLDADFHTLLALSGAIGPSVIRIRRQGMKGEFLAALIANVLPRVEQALSRGAVVSITEQSIRFRYLPLRSP